MKDAVVNIVPPTDTAAKKLVKINFSGTYPNFKPEYNRIYQVLKKYYDVQITEDADYVLCDIFGEPYDYCQYPQVRIMYNGENYIPDFNLVDYAVSRYPLQLQDRNFYLPGCSSPIGHWHAFSTKDRNYSEQILKEKIYFANFISSHESEYGLRGGFFKELSKYKRIESPGTYLNNMPNGETVKWTNTSKTGFQRKCKFTLCFESTKHEGFITEKITDAFYADTIPVYYGSSNVTDIFNKNAFINCSDYDSFDDVIAKIIELDNDDQKYLEMLRQPILVNPDYPDQLSEDLERFVLNIFEQPLEQAYRRSRVYFPKQTETYLTTSLEMHRNPLRYFAKWVAEKLKHRISRLFG